MDYSKLQIKTEYYGKYLQDNNKKFLLTEALTTKEKTYIYNNIIKSIFTDQLVDYSLVKVVEDAPIPEIKTKITYVSGTAKHKRKK